MIRYGAVRNTFILKDYKSGQTIEEFKSAQKLFSFLGGRVFASDTECKYYGTFVKVLGEYNWRNKDEMNILIKNGTSHNYKLVLRKELR